MTIYNPVIICAMALVLFFSFYLPVYSQCTKDTDCRGNRICDYDSGRCVANEEDDPPQESRSSQSPRRMDSDHRRDHRQKATRCCDAVGIPWCAQVLNPGQVGEPCWCAGLPGYGQGC